MWWWSSTAPHWTANRNAKHSKRDARIAKGRKLLSTHAVAPSVRDDILAASAPDIARGVADKRWTALDALAVFVARAIDVQDEFNPATEILFEDAWQTASELDRQFARDGKLVGPLHGVPVSFKDQYDVTNFDSTIGFTQASFRPAHTDAPLVTLIRQAGGVPFIKTNVPQTMLSFECANPLWGVSRNPYDASRIPGGSSGGEAVLLAADASALGFGSDIGGSLRIPAAFSGCFGFKPCSGRVPAWGMATPSPGFEAVKTVAGPMGRSVDDLEIAMKIILSQAEEFAKRGTVIPLKWRDYTVGDKKLKFGYYVTDGFCRASPPVRRAVLETVEALRRQGHECVEVQLPDAVGAMEAFVALTSADGYETLMSGLMGDPREASLFLVTLGPRLPWFLRALATWIVRNVAGDPTFARILAAAKYKTVRENQSWLYKKQKWVERFHALMWGELGLDGIICPPQATPALRHDETANLSPLAIGTIVYNVAECAAGIVPVTRVDKERDAIDRNGGDFLAHHGGGGGVEPGSKLVEGRVYGPGGAYDAVAMHGLPVSVQVVAGWCQEEKALALMRVVDEALGPRGFGPGQYAKQKK